MANNTQTIIRNGLWQNNQALVALLGLCPLLAVSNTVINSLGLGIATTLTLVLSNGLVSSLRRYILPEIRLPLFVLMIAGIVTIIELLMNAWFYELYKTLGIFIPLIVTNCAIIGRAEVFASKNRILPSLIDGLAMGLGFSFALLLLGAFREVLGAGTLFSQADLLFGEAASHWQINVFDDYSGMLLALLPPGAFIALGLLVAAKNAISSKL
ncbi:electron transport complex protein RnfE [Bathymodiolus platifrons methanotrophic gill symbiont]|uniref:electron transport complex subunit E n=1 Tax=Bathymodiolus platifrons methanotrophic gill symbiont TaxID=113268 RepID=UPI000B41D4CA|nr:electron transport complex subunit E [Bathymodiolus platifrons methanotrophic gill symbiont]TXK94012.1 electron transport complex subunit RsxE [Methylococcaceae bacterium CS4]TXK94255.1 electron transport complex subunit RsxE [Methylococcaceae bacterium CS5]TXL02003.1 electron transport complex subunit RsxE [Methylococcaceae bacterium HT1]TXL04350.1 electron transport complex subunit RsxE [Methylococcaceae bacterium CS1]TXL09467.1 electron transport complex subunit RsxE [Methylococcaceae ba